MTTVTSGQSKTPTATSPAGSGKIRKFSSLLHGQAAEEESFFRIPGITGKQGKVFQPSRFLLRELPANPISQKSSNQPVVRQALRLPPSAAERGGPGSPFPNQYPTDDERRRLQKPTRKYCRRHQTHNRRRPPEIRGGRRLQRTTTRKSELYFPVIFPLESVTAQK